MVNYIGSLKVHLIGLSVVAGCLLGGYFFGLRPVLLANQALQQIADEGESLQAMLPAMEQEMSELTSQLAIKQQQLKSRYCIATPRDQSLIGIVSHLLQERKIELGNLREEAVDVSGEATIVLQIAGQYSDLLRLLHDLRRLDRPAKICSLSLTPNDQAGGRCSARLSLRFARPQST